MPFTCDDPRVDRWALETLEELWNVQDKSLVEILPAISLHRENSGPSVESMGKDSYFDSSHFPVWTQDSRLQFQHLTVEMLDYQNQAFRLRIPPLKEMLDAGYKHAWLFQSPVCNSPKMLQSYLDQLENEHGMDVNVQTNEPYESLEHIQASAQELGCDAVVNCTGMGARDLLKDEELVPGRGAILQFDRETCVRRSIVNVPEDGRLNINDAIITVSSEPWGSETHPAYLIPRGDTIVVGGTVLRGDEETSIRPEERQRLLQNAQVLGIDVQQSQPVGEWVGFRPVRQLVKCEFEEDSKIPIFHNYGHGGSGWTVHIGAAKECVNQFLGKA